MVSVSYNMTEIHNRSLDKLFYTSADKVGINTLNVIIETVKRDLPFCTE